MSGHDYTQEQINEIMLGDEKAREEMYRESLKRAPKCHFRPMIIQSGDVEYGSERWYECTFCGHTKPI